MAFPRRIQQLKFNAFRNVLSRLILNNNRHICLYENEKSVTKWQTTPKLGDSKTTITRFRCENKRMVNWYSFPVHICVNCVNCTDRIPSHNTTNKLNVKILMHFRTCTCGGGSSLTDTAHGHALWNERHLAIISTSDVIGLLVSASIEPEPGHQRERKAGLSKHACALVVDTYI